MGNSVKYSGESVSIDVTILRKWMNEKEYYCASLCDNGHGIPDDLKARLFRRYQRGSDRVGGTGLGLYLVKNILEGFGGWAEVRDRIQEDHKAGACFDVCLPAYEPKNL
jgi:signal transduction histidine kinase